MVYIISLVCYYIHPSDETITYGGLSLIEYIKTEFLRFLSIYYNDFICRDSLLISPLIVLFLLLIVFHKKYEGDYKKLIIFASANIILLLLFYFFTFFPGYYHILVDLKMFWIESLQKFTYTYKLMVLFIVLLTIGYLTDMNTKINAKQSVLIKLLLCVFTLTVFYKPLIGDYGSRLNQEIEYRKALRKHVYILEKCAVNDNKLPDYPYGRLCSDVNSFKLYVKRIHPELADKEIIGEEGSEKEDFTEFEDIAAELEDIAADMGILFTEQELEELKFQNLMPKRQK